VEYDFDTRFCQIAIQTKIIGIDRLAECAAVQRAEKESGQTPRRLDRILLEKGYVTKDALGDLLTLQQNIERKTRKLQENSLKNFRVLMRIGRGGMGSVYKALDLSANRIVALKVLSAEVARQGRNARRFLREAKMAANLRHPNIIRGFKVGWERGIYYYVMEYVEGETVGDMLRGLGRIPEARVIDITLQVLSALDYAASCGVVHRDIKPDNMIVDRSGCVKLCDLGLARAMTLESCLTTSGITLGTPKYISPEQARGESEVDIRSDLYSLGISLYHMLVGEPPFLGPSGIVIISKHLYEKVPRIRVRCTEISRDMDHVVYRMTRKEPKERYQRPFEAIGDLEALKKKMHRSLPPRAPERERERSAAG
jgi:serine/threonine-protein kinase